MKTTLDGIALEAGVSRSTVSKALNNRSDVHPETRETILKLAEKFNYRPDLFSTASSSHRTGTVGLITDDLVGRFSIPILTGAENAAGHEKTSVFLCDARGDKIRESFHIESLLRKRIDGLIIVGSSGNTRKSLGKSFPVPVVYAYGASENKNDCSIVADNEASGELAAEHLLSLGRTKIIHIAGLKDSWATIDRIKGFQRILAKQGVSIIEPGPLYGDWSESWGRAAISAVIDRGVKFDGVFCGNDQIARGCIEMLKDRGLKVPQDVSVVGFDNWDVITEGSRPKITSIDMNLEELGRVATDRLFSAINGHPFYGVEKIKGRLVFRGSTVLN